jgi:hypothetical protein
VTDVPPSIRLCYDEQPCVTVTDIGVVKHVDPETGAVSETHDLVFTVMIDGVEHGLAISSGVEAMTHTDVYDLVVESGTKTLLERVGLK